MITPKTRLIGKNTYTVTPLSAIPGRRVFVRLAKVLGPAVAKGASVKGDDSQATIEAFAGLMGALSEDDIDFFCDTFAASTTVRLNGKEPDLAGIFDLHFAGNYLEMFRWLAFCVEVNFGDFFAGLRRKVETAAPQDQAPTT